MTWRVFSEGRECGSPAGLVYEPRRSVKLTPRPASKPGTEKSRLEVFEQSRAGSFGFEFCAVDDAVVVPVSSAEVANVQIRTVDVQEFSFRDHAVIVLI